MDFDEFGFPDFTPYKHPNIPNIVRDNLTGTASDFTKNVTGYLNPDGWTWHHHQEKGILQLVDYQTHADSRHIRGRKIWGGGSKNR